MYGLHYFFFENSLLEKFTSAVELKLILYVCCWLLCSLWQPISLKNQYVARFNLWWNVLDMTMVSMPHQKLQYFSRSSFQSRFFFCQHYELFVWKLLFSVYLQLATYVAFQTLTPHTWFIARVHHPFPLWITLCSRKRTEPNKTSSLINSSKL